LRCVTAIIFKGYAFHLTNRCLFNTIMLHFFLIYSTTKSNWKFITFNIQSSTFNLFKPALNLIEGTASIFFERVVSPLPAAMYGIGLVGWADVACNVSTYCFVANFVGNSFHTFPLASGVVSYI